MKSEQVNDWKEPTKEAVATDPVLQLLAFCCSKERSRKPQDQKTSRHEVSVSSSYKVLSQIRMHELPDLQAKWDAPSPTSSILVSPPLLHHSLLSRLCPPTLLSSIPLSERGKDVDSSDLTL